MTIRVSGNGDCNIIAEKTRNVHESDTYISDNIGDFPSIDQLTTTKIINSPSKTKIYSKISEPSIEILFLRPENDVAL